MKTKQELSAARAERAKQKQELAARFPGARLDHCDENAGVTLTLEKGEDSWITVGHRGDWCSVTGFPTWTEKGILLDDPVAIIGFIRALTARYNALVQRMNSHADHCTLSVPKAINSGMNR